MNGKGLSELNCFGVALDYYSIPCMVSSRFFSSLYFRLRSPADSKWEQSISLVVTLNIISYSEVEGENGSSCHHSALWDCFRGHISKIASI